MPSGVSTLSPSLHVSECSLDMHRISKGRFDVQGDEENKKEAAKTSSDKQQSAPFLISDFGTVKRKQFTHV